MNIFVLQILNEGRIRNSLAYQFLPRQLCKHQKNTNHRHQHCHCHHHCQHHHHPHRQHHHVDDDHHHRQHYHHIKFQGGKWHGPVCGEDLSLFPGWYPICIAWSHLIQYTKFNDPYYHLFQLQWAILSSLSSTVSNSVIILKQISWGKLFQNQHHLAVGCITTHQASSWGIDKHDYNTDDAHNNNNSNNKDNNNKIVNYISMRLGHNMVW